MHLVISNKSNQPIYEQLYDQIVSQIVNGELAPGFCLPSIRTVAKEIGVSIITIKKAWEMLEKNGFIDTIPGKAVSSKRKKASPSMNKNGLWPLKNCKNTCSITKTLD
mgnify:CR=1 FL=1